LLSCSRLILRSKLTQVWLRCLLTGFCLLLLLLLVCETHGRRGRLVGRGRGGRLCGREALVKAVLRVLKALLTSHGHR